MSRRLIGVWCVPCQRKGHNFQAQMWEGNMPVCLRCADGELCCADKAVKERNPEEKS